MTIEELKQALEAATLGPWAFNFEEGDDYTTIRAGEFEVADTWFCPEMPANAHLIVEAVNNLPKLLKVAEAAQALQVINTVIESRLSDELEDIERDVNAQEDAENALRKALEELNDD